jgi:hypothetical protein
MNETALVFGKYQHLVGVATDVVEGTPRAGVGVVFLTSGMLHHVGPFRLHVLMARRLAQAGIASLRFCLSGIGESLGVGGSETSLQRAAHEAGAAMDWMAKEWGIEQFILFGLCSGADDSIATALQDPRVVGVAAMDGCGYPTRGFYWRRYAIRLPLRMLSPQFWRLWFGRLMHRREEVPRTLVGGEDLREFPGRMQAEYELQQLVDRGVQLYFFYTGGVPKYYNHLRQFKEMFPRLESRGQIKVDYHQHLDHVARLSEDRQFVVQQFTDWIRGVVDRR